MLNSNIFNKILVFLRLRKKAEGFTLASECRMFWDFQIFNIADHNQSRFMDAYYATRRFFLYNAWVNPARAYREIKWFIQRGRRGWADCDVWSLDNYLNGWLPNALRCLKEQKQGIPSSMFEPEDCIAEGDWQGNPSEEGMVRAEARWDAIMDKMIVGFEADERSQNGLYQEELGDYPMDRPSGVAADTWEKVKHDRHFAIEALRERDRKLAEEGMTLFIKHYQSLWD
jgi:hypothetical protein